MRNEQRRLLIVEDNFLIAMDVERMVTEYGCEALGPVSNVAAGLDAISRAQPDGAILDVNLGDERVWPVAEMLDRLGVPFVLTTGYSSTEVPEEFRSRPLLQKPLLPDALGQALREIGVIPG